MESLSTNIQQKEEVVATYKQVDEGSELQIGELEGRGQTSAK